MKDLFQRLKSGDTAWGEKPAAPRLTLGAFGKHPGWDDHILGIGVETETLAQVKQALYVGGIGGQIDSGVWEKLEPEKRLVGYDHTFLWLRPGHVILGQLWSSTDGKGRSKYPMVLCIDGEAVAPGFMLTHLLPGLEHLREACKATTSAEQVTKDCRAAQEQLRAILTSADSRLAEIPLSAEARRRFLQRRELGPDRLGFLRALHELGTTFSPSGNGRGVGAATADSRSRHLRLPLASDSQTEALLLWGAFFRCAVPDAVPLLLISRAGVNWTDVIIGEPASDDFFCLQASNKAMPLATEIPYELPPELRPRYQALEAKFLGVSSPVAAVMPASDTKPEARAAPPGAPSNREPARSRSKWTSSLFVVGGVILLIAVGAIWLLGGRGDPAKPQARVASASNKPISQPPVAKEQQGAEEFRKAVNSAQAAEQAGNFTNALALYQGAQRLKRDDAQVGAKIQELTPKAAEQVRLAEERAKQEQQAAEEFRKTVNSAQAAEQAGNFTKALALYQGAQRLKRDDAQVGAKIQELTPKAAEQVKLAEERAKQEQQAAEEFRKAVNSAQAAEQAGNFTNALALYQGAQKLKQGDAQVGAKIQELTPKALEQVRKAEEGAKVMSAGKSGGPEAAAKLDAEFEKYLVWFRVLKPTDPRIRTPEVRKEKPIVGQISPQDTDLYLKRIDYLRSEYEKGGRLNENDRQKNLEKLRETLLSQ
jgi:hypothetical protein